MTKNFYVFGKNLLSAYYVPGPRDTKSEFQASGKAAI